ncbi:hypothetical protein Pint_21502 [Pistacia integerrima]|uniref:Uncharacterized protein n=1 Tax=Pistacia integerrima TaxID=434235 RepID=A0ACC0X7S8_9ROSI|nr:hypothetical protein Pint_21502 [Pistacia integerrima]
MMSITLQADKKLKIGIVFVWALGDRGTEVFFSACADTMMEVGKREEAGIVPGPDVDTYMKVLGLDIYADTIVGDDMRRGISGGQKRRLTTGEMVVGPQKAYVWMKYQMVHSFSCLQQLVHIIDATVLISLLQPAPETFELFDDIISMAEGKVLYQGSCDQVVELFRDCGFRYPQRKGVAEFLLEVISRKGQAQYWYRTEDPYHYVSVLSEFKESPLSKKLDEDLSELLITDCYHCNYYCDCILRTQMAIDVLHATYYMGALFYGLMILLVDRIPELSLTTARLLVFFKQKELCFYLAWAYAIPTTILKIPLSVIEYVTEK